MSLLIYLPLTGYLRQWTLHQLGSPVRFPRASYENAVIARYLSPLPTGHAPQVGGEDKVPIVAPTIHGKPPERYNYFGRRGVAALTEAINTLFTIDLWNGLAAYITAAQLTARVDDWSKSRGISIDHHDAVRKRFLRLRQSYTQRGVILSRRYNKQHAPAANVP